MTEMLKVIEQRTGMGLGTLSFDGKRIAADSIVGGQMIEARRRQGLNEEEIWAQLDGWSNGYLSIRHAV